METAYLSDSISGRASRELKEGKGLKLVECPILRTDVMGL